jgi:DNA-binding NtrC family response regulator
MSSELILVDDDEILLVILEKMILKVNPEVKVIPFNTGKKALSYLNSLPQSDSKRYLLVDINLKDMSGWDFLNELEARKDKFSKVILITSSVSSSNPETAKKHPHVIGFFEKPLTFEVIRQIMDLIRKNSVENLD